MRVVDIVGFPNYTISEDGVVMSKDRQGKRKPLKAIVLAQVLTGGGYKSVCLCADGKKCGKLVHRLIALHFIPNPNNYPFINHIDGNKLNNALSNLEWCTEEMNRLHAINVLGVKHITEWSKIARESGNMNKPHKGKKIAKTDKEGNIIAKYKSLIEAAKENNINPCVLSYLFSKRRAGRKPRNTDKINGYYFKRI